MNTKIAFICSVCLAPAPWLLAQGETCNDLRCRLGRLSLSDDGAMSYLQRHAAPVPVKEEEVTADGQAGSVAFKSKVAVCISGQIARLELDSKVRNVFIPLMEQQSLVHVFVALEAGGAKYVNPETALDAEVRFSPDDIRGRLHPFYQAGSIHPHLDHNMDISHWSRNYLATKIWVNRSMRLAGHMAQHANLKACVDLIEDHELKLGIRYDVILKLRDNTIAPKPFKLMSAPDIDRAYTQEAVLVKDCAEWGGINDKVMVIPRRHLRTALAGPYTVLMGVENGDPTITSLFAKNIALTSPEMLYSKILKVYDVPVLHVSTNALPFVDARCQKYASPGKSLWCPVPQEKDCWPDPPWNFSIPVDCHVKMQHTTQTRLEWVGHKLLRAYQATWRMLR
mmetsp:Transcript_150968/g.267177  ORF Transcript_150968/g.267177 Transcript_150968/m.267177 type:complete len:395 (-) Transcript_150968:2-1186(-)